MNQTFIILGQVINQKFVPDEPLPNINGIAELRITAPMPATQHSIAETLGKAHVLRSQADIELQIRTERSEWDESDLS